MTSRPPFWRPARFPRQLQGKSEDSSFEIKVELTSIFRLAQGISVGGNVAMALGSGSPAALLDPYGIN
jgi:hypothetical protein